MADRDEVSPEEPTSFTRNTCDRFNGQAFHSTSHSLLMYSIICAYGAAVVTVRLLSVLKHVYSRLVAIQTRIAKSSFLFKEFCIPPVLLTHIRPFCFSV